MMHQSREIFVIILAIAIGVGEAAQAQCQATELAKLTASDAGDDDEFGRAVSISGNVAVIGAYHDDDVGEDAGSAYVYRFEGASWIEEAQLTASDAEPGDLFGYSTFVNGDVILIGAYQDDNVAIDAGSVYVFRYDTDESKWIEEAKLTRPDADSNDQFGWRVHLSGDIAIIAAVHDDDGATNAGAVYVYRFDPETVEWIDQAKLTASDTGPGHHFGWSISLSGDVAVIGSPLHDGVGMNAGSAYIFGRLGDCNDNGELDLCDIADGKSTDDNNNGIPDECENDCPWDLFSNGVVGPSDLLMSEPSDWNLGCRGGALQSCSEGSAMEQSEGQMGNVGRTYDQRRVAPRRYQEEMR